MIRSALRFSNAQRVSVQDVGVEDGMLRGHGWRNIQVRDALQLCPGIYEDWGQAVDFLLRHLRHGDYLIPGPSGSLGPSTCVLGQLCRLLVQVGGVPLAVVADFSLHSLKVLINCRAQPWWLPWEQAFCWWSKQPLEQDREGGAAPSLQTVNPIYQPPEVARRLALRSLEAVVDRSTMRQRQAGCAKEGKPFLNLVSEASGQWDLLERPTCIPVWCSMAADDWQHCLGFAGLVPFVPPRNWSASAWICTPGRGPDSGLPAPWPSWGADIELCLPRTECVVGLDQALHEILVWRPREMERGNKVRPLVGRSLMWTANFRARAMPSRWVSASSAMIADLNMLAKIVGSLSTAGLSAPSWRPRAGQGRAGQGGRACSGTGYDVGATVPWLCGGGLAYWSGFRDRLRGA